MKFSMDSVLSRRMLRLLTVREMDCGIVKLKVLTEIEDSFCLVPVSITSVFSLFS